MSLWKHHDDWNNWLNSDERANIKKKYDAFCTTLFGMQEDSSTV